VIVDLAHAAPALLSDSSQKGRGFRCDPGPISRLIEPFADCSALSHLGRTSGIWGFISWEHPLKSIVSALAGAAR
jgi:hypothetical protein